MYEYSGLIKCHCVCVCDSGRRSSRSNLRQVERRYPAVGDRRGHSLQNPFHPGPHYPRCALQTSHHPLCHWYQRFANGKYTLMYTLMLLNGCS